MKLIVLALTLSVATLATCGSYEFAPRAIDCEQIINKVSSAVSKIGDKALIDMEKNSQKVINVIESGSKKAIEVADKLMNVQNEVLVKLLEKAEDKGISVAHCGVDVINELPRDSFLADSFKCTEENTDFIRKLVKTSFEKSRDILANFNKFIEENAAKCKTPGEWAGVFKAIVKEQLKIGGEIKDLVVELVKEQFKVSTAALKCQTKVSKKYVDAGTEIFKKAISCVKSALAKP